jgi:hypothetical protein
VKAPPKILPPLAIVAEKKWLTSQSYFRPEWEPVLDRLCGASIWSQLNKRSPVVAGHQLIERWAQWRMGEVPDEKWLDRDVALQVAFLESFFLAVSGMKTITAAEQKELVDSYRGRARRLRQEAAWLKEKGEASEAAEHGRAIERAAAWCEAEADEMVSAEDPNHPLHDNALLVDRHQAPPHVRAYCVLLAEAMRLLYGTNLRGTVAAIATAALDQQVSAANVRYWCENKSA